MKERLMKIVFLAAACVSVVIIVIMCLFLFGSGIPTIREIGIFDFLFGRVWSPGNNIYGILPFIIGSIYVTLGAIIIGVLTAIYMVRFCGNKLYKLIKPAVNLMAGIPSIVYGFFGLWVIVPLMRELFGGGGKSILTASILLGIMILPTIVNTAETAIRAVPEGYYEGSLALGATHERSVFAIVTPAAKSGILAGIILGVGRAIGETMALIMIAGNQTVMPSGIFNGVRTLTGNIVMEIGYATDLHRDALIATGVVLFVFILIINSLFSIVNREKKNSGIRKSKKEKGQAAASAVCAGASQISPDDTVE